MKKIFALLISFTLTLGHLSFISSASYDDTNCLSLSRFTGDFVELVNNDNIMLSGEANKYYSFGNASNEDTDDKAENDDSALRLIVKSTQKLNELDSIGYVYGYNNLHIIQFDNKTSVEKAYDYYSQLSCVEYVEYDSILSEAVIDDGVVVESAADFPTSVQSNIFGYTSAKETSDGNPIDIAVIDSGVQYDHEFLMGRVIDSGFNSVDNSGTSYDDRGHGTHVAGIIVANTLSNVTVHSYKVLAANGEGSATQVALGIDAAVEDNVDIINLSMHMMGTNQTLYDAVLRAYNAGICVIVSAGNSSMDIGSTKVSPGSFDEVISVMSCSNARKISSFSNYGTPCDFAAPGENILSTYLNNTYKISSGTSMAAPFICAATAYLLAADNSLSPDDIVTKLGESIKWCTGTIRGKCVYPATGKNMTGKTTTPVFSVDACDFVGSMYLELSSEANADIFYSINEDDTYKEYTSPILLTETSTVSAFALVDGKNISASKSVKYSEIDASENEFVLDDNESLIAYNGSKTDVIVPSFIDGLRVLSVSESAFSGKIGISSVTFGNSLLIIGENSFVGCDNLTSVTAPKCTIIGASAFKNCDKLSNFSSSALENIGDEAFYGCGALSSFSNTQNILNIGIGSFENTGALKSLSFPKIISIGSAAFKNSSITSIGISNAQEIGDYAFYNCDGISSAVLTMATTIGKGAFENCDNLSTVSASSVIIIPEACFKNCTLLSSTSLNNAKIVSAYAFENCNKISSFDFNSIKTIKEYAFKNTTISTISANSLTEMEPYAFGGCLNLSTVTLNNLKSVDISSFSGASNILRFNFNNATELIVPEGGINAICPDVYSFVAPKLINLPDDIFNGCKDLTTITLTELKTVGKNAFKGTNFTEITFPQLTSADDGAFSDMVNLQTISLPRITSVTASMFENDIAIKTVNLGCSVYPEDFYIKDIFPNITKFSSDGIRRIHPRMFMDCEKLSAVYIDEVGSIGDEAFKNCALNEINLSVDSIDGVDVFDGNPLTNVVLSNLKEITCDFFGSAKNTIRKLISYDTISVESVDFRHFSHLEHFAMYKLTIVPTDFVSGIPTLKQVTFSGVKTVEAGAFADCTSLETVYLASAESIGADAFENCVALKTFSNNKIKKLDTSIFDDCSNLEDLELSGLEYFPELDDGTSFFATLKKLRRFETGSFEEIPANAFVGCEALASVYFGDVSSIGSHAFFNCSSLTSVYFDSIKTIGNYSFYNTSLVNYEFPDLQSIGEYAFYNTDIVEFDVYIKSIGKGAFAECKSLEYIYIHGLKSIPDYAFYNNTSLIDANFGYVSNIGKRAFKNCDQLSTIYLGSDVVIALADEAFYGCSNMKTNYTIKFSGIGSYALYGCKIPIRSEAPELIKISENAFEGYPMDLLILENVEEIYDVPEGADVLIGTDVTKGALPDDTTATIYSPKGSLVSQYCISNGVNYKEFNETNPIITNTGKTISAHGDKLTFDALGFNLEFDWYACNKEDMSDSVLMESGVKYYTPFTTNTLGTERDFKYYYCIATSTENGNVVEIRSNLVRNTYTFVYSLNNKNELWDDAETNVGYIYSQEKDIDDFYNNMYFEEGACEFVPSLVANDTQLYGTGASVNVCVDGEKRHAYTLILGGDINGDGYVDVLDCSIAASAASGKTSITDENQLLAAELYDGYSGVSVADYQAIVNKAVS